MTDDANLLDAAASGKRFDDTPKKAAKRTPAPEGKPGADDKKKPSPVGLLVNHVAAPGNFELVRWQGAGYAINRNANLAFLNGPVGVAQPLAHAFQLRVIRMATVLQHPNIPRYLTRDMAATVVLHLEASVSDHKEHELDLRFSHDPAAGRVVIDLGRDDGQAIVITAGGWEVTGIPADVIFRRGHAVRPLPDPERGGSLLDLAPLLALDPSSATFKLLVSWAIGLPFAESVRPGVLFLGPPGCGKTTRLRLLCSIVEPSPEASLGSAFGQKHDDDIVRAVHRAVPLWDNLSGVSQATSDLLCCIVTGTSRETRTLYSNGDLSTLPVKRPLGLTAVGRPAGLRQDALDRLITIEVDPIAERIDDAEVQAAFNAAHPRLLGALCDAVAAVLRYQDKVAAPTEYRMAAFARTLACVDAAVGDGELTDCPGDLLTTYAQHLGTTRQSSAAEDVFGGAILELLHAQKPIYGMKADGAPVTVPPASGAPWLIRTWTGLASQLKSAAEAYLPYSDRMVPGWPTSARKVPELLGHLKAGLTECGVTFEQLEAKLHGKTQWRFTLRNDDAPSNPSAAAL